MSILTNLQEFNLNLSGNLLTEDLFASILDLVYNKFQSLQRLVLEISACSLSINKSIKRSKALEYLKYMEIDISFNEMQDH